MTYSRRPSWVVSIWLGRGDAACCSEQGNCVMLNPLRPFAEAKPEDVFGCLAYDGPPKTIEEMDEAVLAEAARRHADVPHSAAESSSAPGTEPN